MVEDEELPPLRITITVFSDTTNDGGPHWETAGISLVSISNREFPLTMDEINILTESLSDIRPVKDNAWHNITLERECIVHGASEPREEFYSLISIESLDYYGDYNL